MPIHPQRPSEAVARVWVEREPALGQDEHSEVKVNFMWVYLWWAAGMEVGASLVYIIQGM